MKPVEISDLYSFRFFGGLKGKGRNIVFVRGQLDEKANDIRCDLMLCRDKKIRQLTSRGNVRAFAFEDPKTVWFFLSGASEKEDKSEKTAASRLYSLSLKGGEAIQEDEFPFAVCTPVGFADDHLLVFTAVKDLNEEAGSRPGDVEVLDETPWYANNVGFTSKKRQIICVYDTQKKETIARFGEEFFISAITIHQNRVYFSACKAGPVHPLHEDEIFEFDPKTGLLVSLAKTNLDIYTLNGVKDTLLYFGSDGNPIGLNSNANLYELSLDSRKQKCVMRWDESIGNTVGTDCAVLGGNMTAVSEDRLFFTATIVNHVTLFCFEDGALHQVLEWPGTIHSFGFADGRLYFIGAEPSGLQELYVMDEGDPKKISDFQTGLEDKYVARARPVFFTGSEGSSQLGWVLYPMDFHEDEKYPAILDIHGGPKTVYGTVFYHEMQVWASKGYFVFFCNPFGSDGQGNAYADMRGRYGTADYDDLMRFTDAVLEQIPQIDENRLGVTGGSYGGFMTNWIVTHTNRFKAAATQRSISNWISFWGTSDIGPEFTLDQQGADLSSPDVLWEHSPMKYIANAKTPTLLIHSDEDYRCPLEQGYQMFNGLLHNGVEARMVLFHHENHELSRSGRPQNRVRRLEEITDWMDSHLKGKENEA